MRDLKLDIVYEDALLLVVNKPRGISSVKINSNSIITLADLLIEYFPACEMASKNSNDGGLVQRLDFYSSGLIIAAKNRKSWEKLFSGIKNNEIKKTYEVIVEGELREGITEISFPLYKKNNKKMAVLKTSNLRINEKLFPAKTFIKKISLVKSPNSQQVFTMLEVSGHGMRRHQIRAHLSALGFPLAGDELYGAKTKVPFENIKEGFFLHCSKIQFHHPATNELLVFCI